MKRTILAAAAFAAIAALAPSAQASGTAPWCAIQSKGQGDA